MRSSHTSAHLQKKSVMVAKRCSGRVPKINCSPVQIGYWPCNTPRKQWRITSGVGVLRVVLEVLLFLSPPTCTRIWTNMCWGISAGSDCVHTIWKWSLANGMVVLAFVIKCECGEVRDKKHVLFFCTHPETYQQFFFSFFLMLSLRASSKQTFSFSIHSGCRPSL